MPNTNPNAMPNYRHGISNATIAIQSSPGVYGTPWKEVGAQSVTPQRAEASSYTAYSDNGKPANIGGTRGSDTFQVQFASFSDDYNTLVLGHKRNPTTGGTVKSHDDKGAVFAFGYQVEGTTRGTRVWEYGCTSSEPAANAFQSDGENVQESPDTCTLKVAGDIFADGCEHYEEVCYEGDPGYETFLDAVPTYADGTVVPVGTKLETLAIGSLTLSPAFDANIEAYVVTTTNATDTVTATAVDDGAEVSIEVNGSTHTSGNVATWVSGTNTVVVTVSDGETVPTTNTYIVLVTKE